AMPIAAVYSGHQFGVWAGQLGDGRAILLGDVPVAGMGPPGSLELQLKGAGPTPYSRMGDGRAVLRSSIREFLCSEAMAGLGIPTSGVLCVTGSDLRVMRETPETAAVVTRMAPTFIRFGSFEHWFYGRQPDALRTLADHVIDRFYPELRDAQNPYQALLAEVTRRTAHLIARWQAVGFMHGVMNTDNMSILGLTLDYGPFGFMDAFDPGHICNHTDHHGRYAYHMQPDVAYWNCTRLGRTLSPFIGEDDLRAALDTFGPALTAKWDELLHAKLGLRTGAPGDGELFDAMFAMMQAGRVDFTLFFRRLGDLQIDNPAGDGPLRDLTADREAFDAWAALYRARLTQEGSADAPRRQAMHAVNPRSVLRNHLAQHAIERAQQKDFSEIDRLLTVLAKPFDSHPDDDRYTALPPDGEAQVTVSCSS
ncbi:MAG: protein adenylyltransferase SelO, partial [Nitrospiria bacterium]